MRRNPSPQWWILPLILLIPFLFIIIFLFIKPPVPVALKLTHLGSGTIMTDGTEQLVFRYSRVEPFRFSGYINLSPMNTGDRIIIREYVKIKHVEEDFVLYKKEEYKDKQEEPMVYITPKDALFGIKVTIQQVAGVFHKYDWEFYAGFTS